jgi:peroxiredoxin
MVGNGTWKIVVALALPAFAAAQAPTGSSPEPQAIDAVRGVVKTRDGEAARGAEVTLLTRKGPNVTIEFLAGRADDRLCGWAVECQKARTDDAGHFEVQAISAADVVTIIHNAGFADLTVAELKAAPDVTLRPWGRIEGTLRIGQDPAPGREIRARIEFSGEDRLSVSHVCTTKTDASGRFVLDRVPPGKGFIGPYHEEKIGDFVRDVNDWSAQIKVEPAERAVLQLGGQGRPVIGHLVVPPELGNPFEWDYAELVTKRDVPVAPEEVNRTGKAAVAAWYAEWYRRQAGSADYPQPFRFESILRPSDKLRVEDVPAGAFVCSIVVRRMGAPGSEQQENAATASTTFEVPPVTGDSRPEPLDIGGLTLAAIRANEQLEVGAAAPPFEVHTLDGKTVRLADLTGKYVLLDFWATWCGPCLHEMPQMKALYEKFGTDSRLFFLGLSSDLIESDLRSYVEKHTLKWPQAFLSKTERGPLQTAYKVSGIPRLFLIGPDGKILALPDSPNAAAEQLKDLLAKRP